MLKYSKADMVLKICNNMLSNNSYNCEPNTYLCELC